MRSSPAFCALLLVLQSAVLRAQTHYENDNVRYATASWRELSAALKQHPEALLLDVRSPGEYADTSSFPWLNIGHIDGAVNISVDSIGTQYQRLAPYRDRPVYVYCSHSQRSRQVCTQLADSGFTKLTNVNGGLTHLRRDGSQAAAMGPRVRIALPYTFINAADMCGLMAKGALLLDIRPDSLLDPQRVTELTRVLGRVKGAVHVPEDQLAKRSQEWAHDRTIVLLAEDGGDASQTALQLHASGFTDLNILFNGLHELLHTPRARFPCKAEAWEQDIPYRVVGTEDLSFTEVSEGKWRIIDVRSLAEFEQRADPFWRNIGRMKGAVNIPADSMATHVFSPAIDRKQPVLVVGWSDGQASTAARVLCEKGFEHVTLVAGGLWDLRWTAHNVEGMGRWEELVEVPKSE